MVAAPAVGRSAWLGPELACFTLRTLPWPLLVAGWVLAASFAVLSRLDSEFEWMLVAGASSIGVGSAMADRVAAFTDATAERRRRRRWRAVVPAVSASFVAWLVAVGVTAAVFEAAPAPGRWAVVGWVAVALSQVAVGGVRAARSGGDPGIAASGFVAAAWVGPFFHPRLLGWLYPIDSHGTRWIAVIVATACVAVWSFRDVHASAS